MDIQAELYRITDALADAGIDYALCGGIAVIIHGVPRLTRDIDLLIRPENLDRVKTAVAPAGYTIESGLIAFDIGQPEERHMFRLTKAEGQDHLILDLILVSPFLEPVWRTREVHRVEARSLRVVSRDGLTTMKRAAGRPRDLEDLRQLNGGEEES